MAVYGLNTFNVAGQDSLEASLRLDEGLDVGRVGEGHIVEPSTHGETGQGSLLSCRGGAQSDGPEHNTAL